MPKSNLKNLLAIAALALATPFVAGCVAATVGAVTVVGADVVLDRRTAGTYVDDNTLELQIRKEILTHDQLGGDVNVSVTAMNGIILLTGEVGSDAQRKQATNIARSYEGVRQVVNELQLAGKTGFGSRTNDTWITTKAKTALLREDGVNANDIKVVTEGGKVYLLGLVTEQEAKSAVAAVKNVSGVTHIIKVFEYIEQPR
ncbi:MAG: BON domain-containing protein [Pseudomonadota bacterium]|nr:BON domain-containing protein [Pseudomonadota bacterium]